MEQVRCTVAIVQPRYVLVIERGLHGRAAHFMYKVAAICVFKKETVWMIACKVVIDAVRNGVARNVLWIKANKSLRNHTLHTIGYLSLVTTRNLISHNELL